MLYDLCLESLPPTPKLTQNVMHLSIVVVIDCGSEVEVFHLQEIQVYLMKTHDFMAKKCNPNSTRCMFDELSHELIEMYALWKRKYFITFVMIETNSRSFIDN